MTPFLARVASAAHSAAATLLSSAQVKIGDSIPTAEVKETSPETKISLADIPGRNIILGVPAAFSPPCSTQLPAYIEKFQEFQAKGVNGIYVVSVNDAFVTQAWKKHLAPNGTEIHFIADDTGAFTGSLGLLFNASGLLGTPRSKRYALIVENGKVTHVAIEENPPDITVTDAEVVLAQL